MSEQRVSALPLTRIAAADIKAAQAVAPDGTVAAKDGPMAGLAFTDAQQGEAFTVETLGLVPAIAGEALTNGDALKVGEDGKLVRHDGGGDKPKVARAWQDAAGDGRRVQVFIIPN